MPSEQTGVARVVRTLESGTVNAQLCQAFKSSDVMQGGQAGIQMPPITRNQSQNQVLGVLFSPRITKLTSIGLFNSLSQNFSAGVAIARTWLQELQAA